MAHVNIPAIVGQQLASEFRLALKEAVEQVVPAGTQVNGNACAL
jgi:hypothetical protein